MRTLTRCLLATSVLLSALTLSGCFVRADGGGYRGNGYGYGHGHGHGNGHGNGHGYGHGNGRGRGR